MNGGKTFIGPATDGSANDLLATDGAGNLTFAAHPVGYAVNRTITSMVQNTWYGLGIGGNDPATTPSARITIGTDQIVTGRVLLSGAASGLAAKYAAEVTFTASNDGGTTTVTLGTENEIQDTAGNMEVRVEADDTNDCANVEVRTTGTGTPTMKFTATVELNTLTYQGA
jgi:hypothetical protein